MDDDKKVLDIFSLDKSKRILVWICEAVITFFFAYILMHAMVTPIYSAIGGYGKIAENANIAIKKRNRALVDEELLYFENEEAQIGEIAYGLSYSYDLFMSDFIKQDTNEPHNILKRFYIKFDSIENYYNYFKIYDKGFDLFIFDDTTSTITLKEEHIEGFNAVIDEADEMSPASQKLYDNYLNKFFLTFYSHILKTMKTQNISLSGVSYAELQEAIDYSNNFYDTMIIICSVISFAVSWSITCIIIPLSNRNKRSISMIMMRIQRIDLNTFRILKKKRSLLIAFYNLVMYLFVLFLIPLPLINIGYLFSMPILLYPSLISLFICLFSFITLLTNGKNQATSDLLTNTIFVTNDTLDDIYKSKGYLIK